MENELYRKASIEFVNFYIGTNYAIIETVPPNPLPPLVEVVIDMLIKGFTENPSIASYSLGDMSKSFNTNGGFFEKALAILDKVKGEVHGEDPTKGTGRMKFY